jgi:hypothetical protein
MPPCPRPRWDPAGFAGGQAPGAVAATAPGTETLAGQFGAAAGENWRGSGHTRVHAMPAAWACDPGMTHDRNGG